jgi:hypothetical protein
LGDELKRLDEHRARLKEAGLGDLEVKRVIDPLESFHLQLKTMSTSAISVPRRQLVDGTVSMLGATCHMAGKGMAVLVSRNAAPGTMTQDDRRVPRIEPGGGSEHPLTTNASVDACPYAGL